MNNSESKCPVCDAPLKTQHDENYYTYEICPKCYRTYWPFPPVSEFNNPST
jgi:hypothetical protein